MWLHLYVTCIHGLFGKEKLENFLEVGLKLNLNSKLLWALYTHTHAYKFRYVYIYSLRLTACLVCTIFYLTKFSIYSCHIIFISSTINMLENLSNSTHDDAHKLDKISDTWDNLRKGEHVRAFLQNRKCLF